MANEKYSVLIVAYDASLLQILPLVKTLKRENPKATICLLTNRRMDAITCEIRKYVSKIIQIRSCNGLLKDSKTGVYVNKCLFLLPFIFLSFRKYDIVNIHFAKPKLLKAMPWLRRMTSNIVISPWGSDVLRLEDEHAISRMQKIYSYASYVTCSPDSQLGNEVVNKFKFDPSKMRELRFGADFFDFVKETQPTISIDEAKKRFCVAGKYVISCGYSTAPSHQHEVFVDAINCIKDKLPNNLVLLFPFTYGWGTPQYIESLKDRCERYNINAVYVEQFLDMENLYALRMAADIYVNIQMTDAGSTSVMQYFLCHKKVVQGTWLNYLYLREYAPSFYFPLGKLEDLGDTIVEAYEAKEIEIPYKLIQQLLSRGWKSEIKKWNEFFTLLLEGKQP